MFFLLQIADQFAVIGKAINLKQCVITGGMDMVLQGQELARRPHIVVATPGRYFILGLTLLIILTLV